MVKRLPDSSVCDVRRLILMPAMPALAAWVTSSLGKIRRYGGHFTHVYIQHVTQAHLTGATVFWVILVLMWLEWLELAQRTATTDV